MTEAQILTSVGPGTFDEYSTRRVSFVLTTKNRAELLDVALSRARSYVTPEDELIVIDGGSTDGTGDVLDRYSDLVSVRVSEPDVSLAHGVNKGILLAQGRYIRNQTDDDILHPDGLEHAIRMLDENPDVGFLVCGGTKQRGDERWTVWLPPGVNYGSSPEDVFRYKGSGAGFIFRRSIVPLIGLLETGPAADNELILKAIASGAGVRFCRINLYHHPIHEGSHIVRHAIEHQRHQLQLVDTFCSRSFYRRYQLRQYFLHRPLLARTMRWFLHAARPFRRSRFTSQGTNVVNREQKPT